MHRFEEERVCVGGGCIHALASIMAPICGLIWFEFGMLVHQHVLHMLLNS